MSASLALEPPLGGIAPLPLTTLAVRPSTPCARRGAQAALSPIFGAPATPAAWQAWQVCVKSAGGRVAELRGVQRAAAVAGDADAGVDLIAALQRVRIRQVLHLDRADRTDALGDGLRAHRLAARAFALVGRHIAHQQDDRDDRHD